MNSGTQVIIQSWFTYFIKQCQDGVSGLVLVLVFRFHTLSFLHNLWDLLSQFSFLNCKWKDIKSKRYCHCPFHATRRIRPRTFFCLYNCFLTVSKAKCNMVTLMSDDCKSRQDEGYPSLLFLQIHTTVTGCLAENGVVEFEIKDSFRVNLWMLTLSILEDRFYLRFTPCISYVGPQVVFR